jgi:predicted phosphodiesterase
LDRIKYTTENETLYVLADTHIGHPNTDLRQINKHIELIQESGDPWLHLGDWVDAIAPDDKRASVEDRRIAVSDEYDICEEMFKPIASQCIAMLRGNHGSKWSRREGDSIRRIARRWDVPYLGYAGLITYKVPTKTYTIWVHHGAGGGRKRGAKAIRLQEWSGFVDADIYLQGHTHTYNFFIDEQMTKNWKFKTRYFANAPGYIKSYRGHDNYIEELGLAPQPTGMIKLTLGEDVRIEPII